MPRGIYIRTKISHRLGKHHTLEAKEKNRLAHIGNIPWNKGLHVCNGGGHQKGTPTWNKGTKGICKPNSGSFKKGMFGERGANWKGGRTILNILIRESERNDSWRRDVFTRDKFICQDCYAHNVRLHAHHLKEFSKILQDFLNLYSQFSPFEDKETLVRLSLSYAPFWDIQNGKTLCEPCHKKYKLANRGSFKKEVRLC